MFVSAAAGAVGSVAGQIAKARGCRVIGSAGSPEKVAYVRDELGFDAAFSHHDDVRAALREAAPDGVDVYFDNVGGPQLEAAIGALNEHGRIALCGAVSQYNATEPAPGPRNLGAAGRQARAAARLHHPRPRRPRAGLPRRGRGADRRRAAEARRDGRRRRDRGGAGAFTDMLAGRHLGKVVVRLWRRRRRAPPARSARSAPRTPRRPSRARARGAASRTGGRGPRPSPSRSPSVHPGASRPSAARRPIASANCVVEIVHAVAPRLGAVLAGDRRGLERARDGQDLRHVGEPLVHEPLQALGGRQLASGRDARGEPAAAVVVAGHRGQQAGAAREVDVDELPRDAGRLGDAGHRHRGGRALLADERPGGVEDAGARVGHAAQFDTCKATS